MEVYFVTTNEENTDAILDEEKFIRRFVIELNEKLFESISIKSREELLLLLSFLFNEEQALAEPAYKSNWQVYDITSYRDKCISRQELDRKYEQWLLQSGRENNMTYFGLLLSISGLIRENRREKYLFLIVETKSDL